MTKEQKVSLITQLSRPSTTPLIGAAGAASNSDVPMYLCHTLHLHATKSTPLITRRCGLLPSPSQPLALPMRCLPHANGSRIFTPRCAVSWEYARLCCGTKDGPGGDGCRKHSSSHEGRSVSSLDRSDRVRNTENRHAMKWLMQKK